MVSECRHLSLIANFCLGNITNLRVMFPGTSLWNANSLFICLPPASVFSTTHLQQFYMYFMRDLDIVLSNRNEYQEFFLGGKGGRCVGLTTLPPSCADCLEIWELQPSGTLRACNRPVQRLLYHLDITVALFLCVRAVCNFLIFQKCIMSRLSITFNHCNLHYENICSASV